MSSIKSSLSTSSPVSIVGNDLIEYQINQFLGLSFNDGKKPDNDIVKRFNYYEYWQTNKTTINQFVKLIESGECFRPGIKVNGNSKDNIKSSQFICLDFDLEGACLKHIYDNPLTSKILGLGCFSPSQLVAPKTDDEYIKARLIFFLSFPVTTIETIEYLTMFLISKYKYALQSGFDAGRFFYGSKLPVFYKNLSAKLDPFELSKIADNDEEFQEYWEKNGRSYDIDGFPKSNINFERVSDDHVLILKKLEQVFPVDKTDWYEFLHLIFDAFPDLYDVSGKPYRPFEARSIARRSNEGYFKIKLSDPLSETNSSKSGLTAETVHEDDNGHRYILTFICSQLKHPLTPMQLIIVLQNLRDMQGFILELDVLERQKLAKKGIYDKARILNAARWLINRKLSA